MKTISFLLIFVGCYYANAQITLIPDENFEWHLVTNGIDTDGALNGQVLTADISELATLNFPDPYGLSDLTGIEDFVSLRNFNCDNCNVEAIDFSNNIELRNFSCSGCDIEYMDFSQNAELRTLFAPLNPTNMINITGCLELNTIRLGNPDDDVGPFATFESIDLSTNFALRQFFCQHCINVTSYDFSTNGLLELFWVDYNYSLAALNLKNGNNSILTTAIIGVGEDLLCIQVDDEDAANNNLPPYDSWWVNPDTILSEDCILSIKEDKTTQTRIFPNPVKDHAIIQYNGQAPIIEISLLNSFGKTIWRKTEGFDQINTSELQRGVFLLKIRTSVGMTTKKIIKN